MSERILITGGTGYIGSHTTIELINHGFEVEIIDNLINSDITTLDQIEKITGKRPIFHKIDLLDQATLNQLFKTNHFDTVLHFAGLKAVSESIMQPLEYYYDNIVGTINLLRTMQNHKVKKIVFSSSATIYGNPGTPKYIETMPTGQNISNPYGRTKYFIEEILKDLCTSDSEFSAISLRYFNPIGNHPSGLIGETPSGTPNNLMPFIMKVASGQLSELLVYGNDYPTKDGTCRRDYIHVVDLANGHLAAINNLKPGFKAYNLGTGRPSSVLEIIHAFEKASQIIIPYKIASRRPGDLPEFWADPSLAKIELNWYAEHSINDAMHDILTYLKNT